MHMQSISHLAHLVHTPFPNHHYTPVYILVHTLPSSPSPTHRWRDFSSGRLNEIPDDMLVEERPAHRPSTYIPQYDVAGRKHLAGEVEEQQPGSDTKIA